MVLFVLGISVNISTAKTDSWCLLKAGCSLWWRCWQGAPHCRCRQSRIFVTEITRGDSVLFGAHAHSPKCERTPERSRAKLPAELWPLLPPFTLTLMSLGRSWRGLCGSTAALVVWQVESVALIKATHIYRVSVAGVVTPVFSGWNGFKILHGWVHFGMNLLRECVWKAHRLTSNTGLN